MVRGLYHLDGPDMKTKAADLIKQEKYLFPSSNVSSVYVSLPLLNALTVVTL
jgi:hypothetical protein